MELLWNQGWEMGGVDSFRITASNYERNQEKLVRIIDEHKVNPVNDQLMVTAEDQPGPGGANHVYRVAFPFPSDQGTPRISPVDIFFQYGPINEAGVNGLTQEVLLAIVADRLRSFQKGPFSCKANACALTHIEEAMHWLQQRTLERMRRGVEGTNKL
jgi:hypothetical protein